MPIARRGVSIAALALFTALSATVVAGCASSPKQATRFCGIMHHGHAAFDPVVGGGPAQLFAELTISDRVAESAPAPLSRDLKTVLAYLRDYLKNPKSHDAAASARYHAAEARVDRYLHDTCGITIPPSLGSLTTTTTRPPNLPGD